MTKKLQDVTPPKRSIHDIPVPNGTVRGRNPISDTKTKIKKKKTSFGKKVFLIIVLGLVAFFLFSFLASSSVVINVISRQLTRRVDANFIAISSDETGGIPFDIVMLDKTAIESIVATGEEEVTQKASGKIIIFNNFSSKSQRLIKNTRFETPEGLIFRIQNSVVVPGQKENSSGETTPGSLEVTVYADQAGEEYNVGLKDFVVPGFEGTDRFDAFYARSKTIMEGGYEGIKKIASEIDIENMQVQLSEKLVAELTEEIKTQIPEGFILYQGGIFSETRFLGTKDMGEKVGVEEKVNVYAVIFNESNLSKYIAESIIKEYEGADLIVSNLGNLDFEIKNKADVIPWVEERFVFSLKGECNFEWLFDEDALKNDFVGKSKNSTNEILSQYSSIDSADIVIKPFWKNSFPRSTGKIEVVIN